MNEFVARKGLISLQSASFEQTLWVSGSISSPAEAFLTSSWSMKSVIYDSGSAWSTGSNTYAGMTSTGSFVDHGDGSCTIVGGACRLYTTTDFSGFIYHYPLSSSVGLSLLDQTINYIVVDYNSGAPAYRVTQNIDEITESSIIPAYTIYRDNNELHWLSWDSVGRGLANRIHQRLVKTERFSRESGLGISTHSGSVEIGSGKVWIGANRFIVTETSSSITHPMQMWYHSASIWVTSDLVGYQSSSYDNGTDLVPIQNINWYGVNWIYRHIDSSAETGNDFIYLVPGNINSNKLSDVQSAQPSEVPPLISSLGMLIGRIIFQPSSPNPIQVDSAFSNLFAPSPTTNHADLSNLDFESSGHIGFVGTSQTSSMTVASASWSATSSYVIEEINRNKIYTAISTGSQSIISPNIWQETKFNVNSNTSSYWIHPQNTGQFTCSKSDIYEIDLYVRMQKISGGNQSGGVRIIKDSIEITGSYSATTYSSNNIASDMYVNITEYIPSGSSILVEIAGTGTNVQTTYFPVFGISPGFSYSSKILIMKT